MYLYYLFSDFHRETDGKIKTGTVIFTGTDSEFQNKLLVKRVLMYYVQVMRIISLHSSDRNFN